MRINLPEKMRLRTTTTMTASNLPACQTAPGHGLAASNDQHRLRTVRRSTHEGNLHVPDTGARSYTEAWGKVALTGKMDKTWGYSLFASMLFCSLPILIYRAGCCVNPPTLMVCEFITISYPMREEVIPPSKLPGQYNTIRSYSINDLRIRHCAVRSHVGVERRDSQCSTPHGDSKLAGSIGGWRASRDVLSWGRHE
ncbi:predicted protein [Histoplasma capsulatum H143]|uniref:Uncharacterized protein n=1 Tax=Ajellomyces capsulatus (strain H143) TaxID=544712 RepID=C6HKA0_AJECH|nr:predicted protein [Histoplasma capsulatum H143]